MAVFSSREWDTEIEVYLGLWWVLVTGKSWPSVLRWMKVKFCTVSFCLEMQSHKGVWAVGVVPALSAPVAVGAAEAWGRGLQSRAWWEAGVVSTPWHWSWKRSSQQFLSHLGVTETPRERCDCSRLPWVRDQGQTKKPKQCGPVQSPCCHSSLGLGSGRPAWSPLITDVGDPWPLNFPAFAHIHRHPPGQCGGVTAEPAHQLGSLIPPGPQSAREWHLLQIKERGGLFQTHRQLSTEAYFNKNLGLSTPVEIHPWWESETEETWRNFSEASRSSVWLLQRLGHKRAWSHLSWKSWA